MTLNFISKVVLAATATLALQACDSRSPYFDQVGSGNPNDQCGSASTQYLIGKPAKAAHSGLGTHRPVRIIGINEAVTQDFVPSRLNVLLDDAGTIVAVNCG